jgi:hypothetical protein
MVAKHSLGQNKADLVGAILVLSNGEHVRGVELLGLTARNRSGCLGRVNAISDEMN